MRTLAWIAIVAGLTTGCTRVGLGDTIDLTFDWNILRSDELHQPYVAGADTTLYTIGVDEDDDAGWTLQSSDPSVLRIDLTSDGEARVTATGPGEATVSIVDAAGQTVHTATIVVRRPDGAALFAHGALIIHRPELQESWDEIQVLVGGSATFEVGWLEGAQRLYGHGALTTVAPDGVVAEARRSHFIEEREWVTFTPSVAGTFDVELLADGEPVRTVRIVAVTEDAIATVRLHGMDESGARAGEWLTVLAQAYDAEERPVFGVEYSWDLDGTAEPGQGDLFRYSLAPDRPRMLGAHAATLDAAVMIHANEGYVDTTNALCSVSAAGAPARASLAPIALAAVVLAFARRRRSRLAAP